MAAVWPGDFPRGILAGGGTLSKPGEEREFRGWVGFSGALQEPGAFCTTSVRLVLEAAAAVGPPACGAVDSIGRI